MSKFNETEWFSAVFLAMTCLELNPRPEFNISEHDLKLAAHELLSGLVARWESRKPELCESTREILALINSESVMHIAKTGGGLQ